MNEEDYLAVLTSAEIVVIHFVEPDSLISTRLAEALDVKDPNLSTHS
jgi:hypothetical protein